MDNFGIVYLLTNPAMPGLVKIGITTRSDVQSRMDELYSTSVPIPFECAFACKVKDPEKVEGALHIAFAPDRVNPKREFFEIETNQAIAFLKLLSLEDVTPEVNRQKTTIDAVDREAGKAFSKKRPNMNFVEMGIPIGSEIIFAKNGETAKIQTERTVTFRGEETTLTSATRSALGEGYAYNVAPGPYWTFNGRRLREIYNETYLRED
ncbi:MAG TPA: GIY-YIG nuclease family protein [Cyclobacteriaceae bacterium]|jgi:hypothetical protein|nr:GIY-YIG nuclease family protein [Cyclobacteriaceae bacterium]